MRYSTAAMFRTAIEERMNLTFSNMAWSCLRDYLYTCALHEPFSDADVDAAIREFKKLKRAVKPITQKVTRRIAAHNRPLERSKR